MWKSFCRPRFKEKYEGKYLCRRSIFIAEGKYIPNDDGKLGNTVSGINGNKIREIKLDVCSKVPIECLSVFSHLFCCIAFIL